MVKSIDLVIHVPLEAEYIELREIFPVLCEIRDDVNVIVEVKAPFGLSAVVIVQEKMGRSSAMHACNKILSMYDPRLYACVGIAGGLSKDLSLGDVCYTGRLADVYDNTKVTDVEGGGIEIALAPEFFSTDRRLTAALGFVRTLSSLSTLHDFWREDQRAFVSNTGIEMIIGRDDKMEVIGAPKCLNGDIVCGAVSESDTYRTRLRGVTRNILAIETESGPIFEICGERNIPTITIRGISDYANASKGKLEGSTKDAIRKIAARNAASFLHMQLQNEIFLNALEGLKGPGCAEPQLALEIKSENPVAKALEVLSLKTDAMLRELSPASRTKPIGFRLPVPRVRQKITSAADDPKRKPEEIEFIKALAGHRRILLYIPRNYPDQALPWVLAGSLLLSDVAVKKALPVVIDASKIGPPRDGFAKLSVITLDSELEQSGAELIFIINEPPFASKTKMTFLNEEIKRWPNARFVFLTRQDKSVVEDTGSISSVKLDTFSLCDVSFLEMAAFIETSFVVPSQEAEVIALKLRGMFKKFDLPAHPSFFAGIPSDALAALLLANRRSELIQLAVDGFLSFVVASDTTQGKLSRTSRTKFLRKLAVEIYLENRSFSKQELVLFTQGISDEFDYNLNAVNFIGTFEEFGLIHFEAGKAVITLPFMASYLFADEMNKSPDLAAAYLKAMGEEPDLSVFDLYAEIGPSKEAVQSVTDSLVASIDAMPYHSGPHILLTGSINPVVFNNPARLTNLSRKVSEARTALSEGASERSDKARILDIADRVSEDVAEESHKEDEGEKGAFSEDVSHITSLVRNWTIATIMLGSGAESIVGIDRQNLAQTIIYGAESLLDCVLRHISRTDFNKIKKRIVADKDFRDTIGVDDERKFENIVSALVDLVEFMALSEPLDRVFDQLPDRAGHRIIGNSVAKAKTTTQIQNLIKRNWLTNINPHEGKSDFLIALHDLPHVQFVRASLTAIFMVRTKWRVPDYDTRMALLDAAAEAVRPYNPNWDKGELIRFVESHVPGTSQNDGSIE